MEAFGKGGVQAEGSTSRQRPEGDDLCVKLLGHFEVRCGEQVIIDSAWPRRRAQALLKLLAVNKGRWLHREQLVDALWRDLEPEAAANNLRKNLHYLRAVFAEHGLTSPIVSAAADMLALSPDVWVDFEAFKSWAKAAWDSRTEAALYEEALALYAGDLLPDEAYEEWTEPQREELRSLRNQLLFELAQLYEALGEHNRSAERLQQLLQMEPLQEEAHRALMRLYARGGDRRKALRQYEKCKEALERELGVEPSGETQALHRLITDGRLRVPSVPLVPSGGAYVGRERELQNLRAAVDDAIPGRGRVALLAGEPGIGKTRTAEELAVYARLRGAEALWGRCYESEGAPPYWPWVQIIRSYVAGRDADALNRDMGAGVADIAQIVPEVREALPDLPPATGPESEQARFRLFDSIARFLGTAAKHQPLFLVLEDLHWADKPSLLLLEFLSREIKGSPLMLLGTYRDVEVGPAHPFAQTLGELSREHPTSRLQLAGLEVANVARFIEIEASVEPPAALVSAVHRETEGNPFFVKEIIHLLAAEGRLDDAHEATTWKLSIPQGVRDVIGRRLGHVSEVCRGALTVASVVGRDFGLNVLERVAELKDDHLLESLDEAVGAHLIDESPGAIGAFRFAHALIRETLYDGLSMTRRLRLHREVGEAIEQAHASSLDLHLAELAHHFLQAIPAGEVDKAIEYAGRAGDRALAMLAYEEAARLYETALQALDLRNVPDEGLHCELLLSLGEAQAKSGDTPKAKKVFLQAADLAAGLGAAEQQARAALGYAGTWDTPGVVDETANLLDRADKGLSTSGYEGSALRAIVLARLSQTVGRGLVSGPRRSERAVALSSAALEIARSSGDPAALARALMASVRAAVGPADIQDRIDWAHEILRLAEETHDRELALLGRDCTVGDMLQLGDLEAFETELRVYSSLATEYRHPLWLWNAAAYDAMRVLMHGQLEHAQRLVFGALTMGQRVYPGAVGWAGFQTFNLRWHQGRLDETEAPLRAWLVQGWGGLRRYLECMVAFLEAELGREAEARAQFDTIASSNFADLHDLFWTSGIALLSQTCASLRDASRAATLYEMLRPYAAQNIIVADGITFMGSVSHYLGLLAATMGRWRDAARHFEDALEMEQRMRSPTYIAHTQHEYARILLTRAEPGDREKAQALLVQALETAREIGMKKLEADAEELIPSPATTAGAFRTILFTDVEGSTALTERLGDEKARNLLRDQERLVREALRTHGGAEIKTLGDGFMASFGSALRAIECAMAIQEGACDLPMRLRIGLNAGEPIAKEEDLYGTAVNAAARIAGQAKGGEILVSDVVRQLVAGKGFTFADRGETALRGFDEPVRLYEVCGRKG